MKQKQSCVIGVAGGSGSGKTTLAKRIAESRPEDTLILSCDDYYKSLYDLLTVQNLLKPLEMPLLTDFLEKEYPNAFSAGRGMTEEMKNQGVLKFLKEQDLFEKVMSQINFDLPKDIDFELLICHLKELCAGRSVPRMKHYFQEGTRKVCEEDRIYPKPVIVVEGLMIFVDTKLRRLFNLRIFVETSEKSCRRRRFKRDGEPVSKGGRDLGRDAETKKYKKFVLPGLRQYVEPTKRYADIILNGETLRPFEKLVDLLGARIDAWRRKNSK